jgi:branched-chain amino acid aminotransferase
MAPIHFTINASACLRPVPKGPVPQEERPPLNAKWWCMNNGYSLPTSTVYLDGEFRRYEDAKLGLLTHGLHYGTGCFEGIRGYWNPKQEQLFLVQLREHYERLIISARMLMMKFPHTVDQMIDLTVELCRRNNFRHGLYIRPFMFKGAEEIGVRLHDVPDRFAIIGVPFDKYINVEGGLRVCTSGWRRIDDTMIPARAKITGAYINSALAKSEAVLSGYDEAIMLSSDGHVSEGSAANIFVVKNGKLFTPDPSQNILEGITRRSIMTIAQEDLGLTVVERSIDRTELYAADEVFFTGTAIGVTPLKSVDNREIVNTGSSSITKTISDIYVQAVTNENKKYASWLTPAFAA